MSNIEESAILNQISSDEEEDESPLIVQNMSDMK